MINNKILIKISIPFFMFVFSIFIFQASYASITNGTIDETYKYAYSENAGWINFKDTNSNVGITDAELTGYGYSENMGWISLNCSNDNSNDNDCSHNDYKVSNTSNGTLSGYAYSENAGWINFTGVSINSSGEFVGYAYGENIGYISFNCSNDNTCVNNDYKVKTDWRPASTRSQCNNGIDDDGDGYIDYPADSGCASLEDDNETSPIVGGGIPMYMLNLMNQQNQANQTITTVDKPRDNTNQTTTIKDHQIFKYKNYNKVYLLDNGLKRWVKDEESFNKLGYKWYDILEISDTIIYPTGEDMVSVSKIFQFTKDLKLRSNNSDVSQLQVILKRLGYFTYPKITTFFGVHTYNAVTKFQKTSKLKTTGVVDKETRDKLNNIK